MDQMSTFRRLYQTKERIFISKSLNRAAFEVRPFPKSARHDLSISRRSLELKSLEGLGRFANIPLLEFMGRDRKPFCLLCLSPENWDLVPIGAEHQPEQSKEDFNSEPIYLISEYELSRNNDHPDTESRSKFGRAPDRPSRQIIENTRSRLSSENPGLKTFHSSPVLPSHSTFPVAESRYAHSYILTEHLSNP